MQNLKKNVSKFVEILNKTGWLNVDTSEMIYLDKDGEQPKLTNKTHTVRIGSDDSYIWIGARMAEGGDVWWGKTLLLDNGNVLEFIIRFGEVNSENIAEWLELVNLKYEEMFVTKNKKFGLHNFVKSFSDAVSRTRIKGLDIAAEVSFDKSSDEHLEKLVLDLFRFGKRVIVDSKMNLMTIDGRNEIKEEFLLDKNSMEIVKNIILGK
jgi:hypothetical protein